MVVIHHHAGILLDRAGPADSSTVSIPIGTNTPSSISSSSDLSRTVSLASSMASSNTIPSSTASASSSSTSTPKNSGGMDWTPVVIGSIIGGGLCLFIVLFFIWRIVKAQRKFVAATAVANAKNASKAAKAAAV